VDACRYRLQMTMSGSISQVAGIYKHAMHTHGGSFSGVIFLKVAAPTSTNDSFDGPAPVFTGPASGHCQSFRTGMAQYSCRVAASCMCSRLANPSSVAALPWRTGASDGLWPQRGAVANAAQPAGRATRAACYPNISLSRRRGNGPGFA